MFLMKVLSIQEKHIAGKRLGRHIEHDPISRAYSAISSSLKTLQTKWWQRMCDPFNQGDLGSCTGNAMVGLLMTEPFYKKGRELSEEHAVEIYSLATSLDKIPGQFPPEDTGSSGLAVMKAARVTGYISAYQHCFTFQSILNALQVGPVITGTHWYSSFDDPNSDGLVEITPDAELRGGHEYQCFGIDLENQKAWFWNSWGNDWGVSPPHCKRDGVKGAFCMSFDTWEKLLKEKGDATRPILSK
jgi:hypothetical protein